VETCGEEDKQQGRGVSVGEARSVPIGIFVKESAYTRSLDDIVAAYKAAESKRNRNTTPESEAEVVWHIDIAPEGLMSSLRVVSARMGVSRKVLTRCATHQVMSWLSESLGMEELAAGYESVYEKFRYRNYDLMFRPIRKQMESARAFSFSSVEPVNTSVSCIGWAVGALGAMGAPLKASWVSLFLVGLAWSLTTLRNTDWDAGNVKNIYTPEVANLLVSVEDARDATALYQRMYERRDGHPPAP